VRAARHAYDPAEDGIEIQIQLDELAVAAFKMALADIRELAELTARSQAEAYDIVSRRIREDVDEATRLLEHR
jgi:phasin family protein